MPFDVATENVVHRLVARPAEPIEQCRFEGEARGRMLERMRGECADQELEGSGERIDVERDVDETLELATDLVHRIGRVTRQRRGLAKAMGAVVPHEPKQSELPCAKTSRSARERVGKVSFEHLHLRVKVGHRAIPIANRMPKRERSLAVHASV